MKRMPKNLGVSANRTVENKSALILINANTTTSATGGDGLALASAAHIRADGGATQSNYSSGGGSALSETQIKTTRLAMRKTLDDKGQLIVVIPDRIIVPPELDETAQILVKSMGRTATTNLNELNPYENMFDVIVWDYLGVANGGSATAWYMQDRKISELTFFWRKALNFGQDESFSTDEALFKAKMRFSVGFSNWRGFYMNAGV
jgi:phage major head subunit gpT-like protein